MIRRSAIVLCWLSPLLVPTPVRSQDPEQRAVVLRVELADGTPVPGVTIRRPLGEPGAGLAPRDGWLRELPRALLEVAWPEVGRTDPNGRLVLHVQDGVLQRRDVRTAAPFRVLDFQANAGECRLRVERQEQFVVRTTDAAGQPLVRFPMVLRQDDRDVAFAVTDARGVATFGVDARDRARLFVAPFGWIGPTDGFPTVAAQLPDKQVECTLPAFVRVRLRTTVGGVARPVALHGARLHSPQQRHLDASGPATVPWLGVELGPVAVGETVGGQLLLAARGVPFSVQAKAAADGLLVVDVEAEPPRPQFALQLVAPGLRAAKSQSRIGEGPTIAVNVMLRLVTEQGMFHCSGEVDATGRGVFDAVMPQLLGQQAVRLDVDVIETAAEFVDGRHAMQQRAWSGSRAFAATLTANVCELGAFEVAAHPGVLRGRVVDEQGRPVPRAAIDVTVEGGTANQRLWSDEQGAFELVGPLLRTDDGAPGRVVATASLGDGPDTVFGKPSPPTAPGATVTLLLARPAKGHLRLMLRQPTAVRSFALRLEWVGADGKVLDLAGERARWQGDAVCDVGPLPVGRGALRILLRPDVLLHTVDGLEVHAGNAVIDARLVDLDLSPRVATCRMRVVDESGVPIAGARVEYRGASDGWSHGPSDAGGLLEIIRGPAKGLRIQVAATGRQTIDVTEVVDGGELRLRPLPNLCVAVKGLPADVPREQLTVLLRSVVRENLGDQSHALLADGDTAHVPLPPAGRYHLRLMIAKAAGRGTTWTFVGQRADDVLVGKDGEALEFVVDDAMVARLRELLTK